MTWILTTFTPSTVPFWDALTTCLSLVAQYLLTRKVIHNSWVWMTADVIYIGLYLHKGLWLTAVLYAGFFVLCVAGLRAWRTSMARDSAPRVSRAVVAA